MDKADILYHNKPIKECNYATDCSHSRLKKYNLNFKPLPPDPGTDFYYKKRLWRYGYYEYGNF